MGSDRKTPLDFARAPDRASDEEIEETLTELIHAFGVVAVGRAVQRKIAQSSADSSHEAVSSALRNFCVLLAESDRPKLTAILVGKLVKLDVVAGRTVVLSELARENGISKQAVSNRMKAYAARIGLPRLESSAKARLAHRLTNRRNYGGAALPQ